MREFMNSKQVKVFFHAIEQQFGVIPSLFKEVAFLEHKDKIFIMGRGVDDVDLSHLRVNSMGLYAAELRNGQVRLSIEGAQIVGPFATKNVVEISDEKAGSWLQGNDVEV